MKKFLNISVLTVVVASSLLSATGVITADEGVISISNFRKDGPAGLSAWQIKEWKGKADVQVVPDETSQALRLKSKGTSTALYKDLETEIRDTPYLNWQWKVVKLPEGGDVRKGETDDQAAQVYVIFPKFPAQVNSRIIGYIWDTSAPEGSAVTSTKFSKTKYIVVRSGKADLGKWLTEKRNVYEDYKKLFNEEPPKTGRASIMIDSDDTKSEAEAFIGEIYLSNK